MWSFDFTITWQDTSVEVAKKNNSPHFEIEIELVADKEKVIKYQSSYLYNSLIMKMNDLANYVEKNLKKLESPSDPRQKRKLTAFEIQEYAKQAQNLAETPQIKQFILENNTEPYSPTKPLMKK